MFKYYLCFQHTRGKGIFFDTFPGGYQPISYIKGTIGQMFGTFLLYVERLVHLLYVEQKLL